MNARVEETHVSANPNNEADTAPVPPHRNRRWWRILAVVVVAAAAGVTYLLLGNRGDAGDSEPTALSFADVVRTDLVQTDSFDGTLGTEDGDPVTSPISGVVTTTADPGTTIEQGDVFLTVDNQPVVLLYGKLPAYRALAPTADSFTAIGNKTGVLTDAVAAGDTIQQGDVLYRINGEPVVVMYGDVPAYRTLRDLSDNMTGDDVLELEQNLVALGYDPDGLASVDEEFTSYTATMVERWQEDLGVDDTGVVALGDVIFIPGPAEVLTVTAEIGQSVGAGQAVATITSGDPLSGDDVRQLEQDLTDLGYEGPVVDGVWDDGTKRAVAAWQADVGFEADGVIDLGEVVYLPGPVRVNEVLASVGTGVSQGTPVLGISSAGQYVTFDLPARNQGLLAVGDAVTIEMPDGTDTPGTVTAVASVATGGQGVDATFEVDIDLDDPSVAVGLDEAPVTVDILSDSVSNVLAVPVSALVALEEGGYAVEVDAGGGSTRLVAVEPGLYADGMVEVSSDGLSAGDQVVVP